MTCQTSLQVPIFRDWRWDNCWIKELQERSGTWDVSTTTETKSIPQLLKKDVTRSSRHWHASTQLLNRSQKNSILKQIAMSTATETEKLRSSIHLPFSAIKLKQKLGRRTKTTGEGSPPKKKKREKGKTSPGEIAVPIFARQPRCTPNSI